MIISGRRGERDQFLYLSPWCGCVANKGTWRNDPDGFRGVVAAMSVGGWPAAGRGEETSIGELSRSERR